MKLVVFHGSPRRGNTYRAAGIFLEELRRQGELQLTEFYLPRDLPVFCTGCQLCLSGPRERCPHAARVDPILAAVLRADALLFTTPHHGACGMSAGMKSLTDHLDFLTMNLAPRPELFSMKAFILTTGSGSAAAVRPLRGYLKNWGMNRVDAMGIRMYTDKWDGMPEGKRLGLEKKLRQNAKKFYGAGKKRPYVSSVFLYHMSKIILRKYVGEDGYPHRYWTQRGYFDKRPF